MRAHVLTPPAVGRNGEASRLSHRWLVPFLLLAACALLPTAVVLPPWAFMWTMAAAVFFSAKWITWEDAATSAVPLRRQLGYFFAWPGLDPVRFFHSPKVEAPGRRDWLFASGKLIFGIAIVLAAAAVGTAAPYLVGWAGMIGLVFVLHLGLFDLLSCAWRRGGVDAAPITDWPIAARSVTEFWRRRWNTAFRDITHRFIFQPLAPRIGPAAALWAVFLFSGFVHELVISLPAGAGYGGPTLYFAIQAAAVFAERSRAGRRIGLQRGVAGRLFAACTVLGPIPLLFHPPFVNDEMVPFLAVIGGLV